MREDQSKPHTAVVNGSTSTVGRQPKFEAISLEKSKVPTKMKVASSNSELHSTASMKAKPNLAKLSSVNFDASEFESNIVRRFVPKMLLSRLASYGHVEKPEVSTHQGLVGFFDISGFSKLAHALELSYSVSNLDTQSRAATSSFVPRLQSQQLNLRSFRGLGAEELAAKLNTTLGALVDIILASGGDVVKFAGDAILVFWEKGNDQTIEEVAFQASYCALRAIEIVKASRDTLNLHIGLGCGNLLACQLGGLLDRWEFVISGDACFQSSSAEKDAGSGKVVISKEVHKHLKLLISQRENIELKAEAVSEISTNVCLNSLSCDQSVLDMISAKFDQPMRQKPLNYYVRELGKGYIPRPVIDMMNSNQSSCSELRKVTVIFFKLSGMKSRKKSKVLNKVVEKTSSNDESEPDPEKIATAAQSEEDHFLQTAQQQVRAVQLAAYTYFGTLRQVIVDDKGFVAIVVLGLPPLYHEDDAVRGIKVAAKLFHGTGVQGTAGICTGTVFCGAIGSANRAEYSVTGSCINMAARLMGKAKPNHALVDYATKIEAEKSNNKISFTELDKMMLKGNDKPVSVYEPDLKHVLAGWKEPNIGDFGSSTVMSVDDQNSSDVHLHRIGQFTNVIGCEDNQRVLSRLSFSKHNKHPVKFVLLEGAPGLGKTHLARWVANAICSKNCSHIFYSAAESSEKQTPFFVWRTILMNILSLQIDQDESGMMENVNSSIHSNMLENTWDLSREFSTDQMLYHGIGLKRSSTEYRKPRRQYSSSHSTEGSLAQAVEYVDETFSSDDADTNPETVISSRLASVSIASQTFVAEKLRTQSSINLLTKSIAKTLLTRDKKLVKKSVSQGSTGLNESKSLDIDTAAISSSMPVLDSPMHSASHDILYSGFNEVKVNEIRSPLEFEPRNPKEIKVRSNSEENPCSPRKAQERNGINDDKGKPKRSRRYSNIPTSLMYRLRNEQPKRLPSNNIPSEASTNNESKFVQLSCEIGDENQIQTESVFLNRVRKKKRLRGRRLSWLNEIIPGLMLSDDSEKSKVQMAAAKPAKDSDDCEEDLPKKSELKKAKAPLPTIPLLGVVNSSSELQDETKTRKSTWSIPQVTSHRRARRNDLSIKERQKCAADIMLTLLEEVGSDGSTLIIIEDAHNMDDASKTLLLRALDSKSLSKSNSSGENKPHQTNDHNVSLNASISGVRFLITFRPTLLSKGDPLNVLKSWCLSPESYHESVHLDPFNPQNTLSNIHEDDDNDSTATTGSLESNSRGCLYTKLNGFTIRETALFLTSKLQVAINEDILSFLHDRSNGNPRAILELFRTLEEQELIYVNPETVGYKSQMILSIREIFRYIYYVADSYYSQGGVTAVAALSELVGDSLFALPPHRLAEVYGRFDLLENTVQLLLKLASVIGKLVQKPLLNYLFNKFIQTRQTNGASDSTNNINHYSSQLSDESQLSDDSDVIDPAILQEEFVSGLKTLKDGGFFLKPHGDQVVFNRDDERSVIYSMMLRQDRKEIHEEILYWFENVNKKACDTHEAGLLGYHALLSEHYVKAFQYFEYSIKFALESGNVSSALSFVQQCNELLENDDARLQLEEKMLLTVNKVKVYLYWGQCYVLKRSWDEAFNVLEIAVDTANEGIARSRSDGQIKQSCLPRTYSGNKFYEGLKLVKKKSFRGFLKESSTSASGSSDPDENLSIKRQTEDLKKYLKAAKALTAKIRKLRTNYAKRLHDIDKLNSSVIF